MRKKGKRIIVQKNDRQTNAVWPDGLIIFNIFGNLQKQKLAQKHKKFPEKAYKVAR